MRHGRTSDKTPDSTLRRCVRVVEQCACRLTRPAQDVVLNWRYVRADRQRIAVFRHVHGRSEPYSALLEWLAEQLPEVRARLELHRLPCRVRDWSRYALVVPWLSDSLLASSPQACREACVLTSAAESQGVPVVNPTPRVLRASRSEDWPVLARWGVRAPASRPIDDLDAFRRNLLGMEPPLLVGEPSLHGGWSPRYLVRHVRDTQRMPLEKMSRPVAVQFIDVRSRQDGMLRKYRYLAIGEVGVAHSLAISQHWDTRAAARIANEAAQAEQRLYCEHEDPNHVAFQRVRCAMGLDCLAIDYSYDQQGQPVIWDLDVLPALSGPREAIDACQRIAAQRAMAATARMWLQRARLEIPATIDQILARPTPATRRLAA